MKVTAYITITDDPKKNLFEFEAMSIVGKLGHLSVTTMDNVEGLELDITRDTQEFPCYLIPMEDIVDLKVVDSVFLEKKKPFVATAPKTQVPVTPLKVRKTYTKKQVAEKKAPAKATKVVSPAKEPKAESKKAAVTKKEIRQDDAPLPVADVLKDLRRIGMMSNRASGTFQAIADKLGMSEDWHTFLSLMTKTEWMKQEQVSKGIMDQLPELYKKSKVELKD